MEVLAQAWHGIVVGYHVFANSPFGVGAIGGLAGAAIVDFAAFRKWQSWYEAETYGWSLATWRWVQGFMVGGLGASLFKGLGG